MRCTYAGLFVLLAACQASAPAPEDTPSPSALPSTSASPAPSAAVAPKLCGPAAALAARLAPIDTGISRVSVGPDVLLPQSREGHAVPLMAPVIVLGPKQMSVGGQRAARPAHVASLVAGQRRALLAVSRGKEGVSRIADVAAALGGDVEILLLATAPDAKIEPVPKGLPSVLSDPSERARTIAEALSKAIEACPPANKLFRSLASSDPAGRATLLKEELPGAVDRCACKVGDDLVDLVAYLLAGDPPVLGKVLRVTEDASAKAISLRRLDGQTLYDSLPTDGASVRFTD